MNTPNFTPCPIGDLMFHLDIARRMKRNLLALGNPGIGKTQILMQYLAKVAKEEGLAGDNYPKVVTKVLSAFDRVDFVMSVADQEKRLMVEMVTEWVADLSNEHNPDGPMTCLYLNEYNCANDNLKSVLFRLLEERALGNVTLRDNVMIFGDGNPPGRGMVAQELSWPEKRRFCTVNVVAERENWLEWGVNNDVHAWVIGFLSQPNHADFFENFSGVNRSDKAWANPASWTKLGEALPLLEGTPDSVQMVSFEGWVGTAAGSAFFAWLQVGRNAPSYEKFLNNPDSIGFDTLKPDVQWFIISQCGNAASDPKAKAELLDQVLNVAYWLGAGQFKEFSFFLTRFIVARNPKLMGKMAKHPKVRELAKIMSTCPVMAEVMEECFKAA